MTRYLASKHTKHTTINMSIYYPNPVPLYTPMETSYAANVNDMSIMDFPNQGFGASHPMADFNQNPHPYQNHSYQGFQNHHQGLSLEHQISLNELEKKIEELERNQNTTYHQYQCSMSRHYISTTNKHHSTNIPISTSTTLPISSKH